MRLTAAIHRAGKGLLRRRSRYMRTLNIYYSHRRHGRCKGQLRPLMICFFAYWRQRNALAKYGLLASSAAAVIMWLTFERADCLKLAALQIGLCLLITLYEGIRGYRIRHGFFATTDSAEVRELVQFILKHSSSSGTGDRPKDEGGKRQPVLDSLRAELVSRFPKKIAGATI